MHLNKECILCLGTESPCFRPYRRKSRHWKVDGVLRLNHQSYCCLCCKTQLRTTVVVRKFTRPVRSQGAEFATEIKLDDSWTRQMTCCPCYIYHWITLAAIRPKLYSRELTVETSSTTQGKNDIYNSHKIRNWINRSTLRSSFSAVLKDDSSKYWLTIQSVHKCLYGS